MLCVLSKCRDCMHQWPIQQSLSQTLSQSLSQTLSVDVALQLQLLSAHDLWPEHAVLHVSNGWAPIMFTTSKSPLGSLPTNPA